MWLDDHGSYDELEQLELEDIAFDHHSVARSIHILCFLDPIIMIRISSI